VHQVPGPADAGVAVDAGVLALDERLHKLELRDLSAEPEVENVITRTIHRSGNVLLTEVDGADVAKGDGQEAHPVGLLNRSDEPGDRIGTAIQETFNLREGRKINEQMASVAN